MDVSFCIEAVDKALMISHTQIFNTDQGCQFTSNEFTEKLENSGIQISRDGRGRVFDNIFIERLWRTVKYEEVYIHSYDTVKEAKESLDNYFRFYNNERLHQSLGYRTPEEVYTNRIINKQKEDEIIHLKEACFLS